MCVYLLIVACRTDDLLVCPGGVTGSRAALKMLWVNSRVGSSPTLGTEAIMKLYTTQLEWLKARVGEYTIVQEPWCSTKLIACMPRENILGCAPRPGCVFEPARFEGVLQLALRDLLLVSVSGQLPLTLPLAGTILWNPTATPTVGASPENVFFPEAPCGTTETVVPRRPHTCQCGFPALILFNSVECTSPICRHYVQYPE